MNTFKKTEMLLYRYKDFKKVIEANKEKIEELKSVGAPKYSISLTKFVGGGSCPIADDEKLENIIMDLENSVYQTKKTVERINDVLKEIEDDYYYEIIELKYFEGRALEYIAEYFDVDISTIKRNKKRLINILKVKLFGIKGFNETVN